MPSTFPTSPSDPRLDGWYHTIELGDGLVTSGHYDHRPVVDCFGIPASLEGKTALDIGTGDGYFAFEMERRGAKRVVAVDLPNLGACDWVPRMRARLDSETRTNSAWPDRFQLAHAMLDSRVEYRHASIYELDPDTLGTFDVVFCGSLLLHLQNPLAALHRVRAVTAGIAIVETAIAPDLEEAFPGRPLLSFGSRDEERAQDVELGGLNSYWLFTTRALEDMLAYADFEPVEPQGTFHLPPHDLPVTSVVGRVPAGPRPPAPLPVSSALAHAQALHRDWPGPRTVLGRLKRRALRGEIDRYDRISSALIEVAQRTEVRLARSERSASNGDRHSADA